VKILATKRLPGEAWGELGDVEIGAVAGRRDDVEVLIVAGDTVDDRYSTGCRPSGSSQLRRCYDNVDAKRAARAAWP